MGAIPRFDGQNPGFRGGDPAANLCEYVLRRHVDGPVPCLPRGPSSRALCRRRHACHWLRKAPLYRFLNAVYRTSLFFRPRPTGPPRQLPPPPTAFRIYVIHSCNSETGEYMPSPTVLVASGHRLGLQGCAHSRWRGRTRTTWMPQQDGDEGHGGEGGTSGERGAEDDAAPQQWQRSGRCTPVLFAVRRSIAGRAAAAGGACGMAGWGSGPAG